jgi:hypothetical protein
MEGLRAGNSHAHEKPRRNPKGQQRGRNSEEARMLAWGAVLVKHRQFGPTRPLSAAHRKAACSPASGTRPRGSHLRGSHPSKALKISLVFNGKPKRPRSGRGGTPGPSDMLARYWASGPIVVLPDGQCNQKRQLMANQKWPRRMRPAPGPDVDRSFSLVAACR